MPLVVKVIPLRAGASQPAGEPRLLSCPPEVQPDTILSFLAQRLGEPVELVWASTEHHKRPGHRLGLPRSRHHRGPGCGRVRMRAIPRVPRRSAAPPVRTPRRPAAAVRPTGRQPPAGRHGHHRAAPPDRSPRRRAGRPGPQHTGRAADRTCGRAGPGHGRHRTPDRRHPAHLAPARPRGPPHHLARRARRPWHPPPRRRPRTRRHG